MLACVADSVLWINNWQVQSFRALDSHRTAVKTSELARRKHYFLSKCRFAIFTNKIIRSTLTLYVANLGIDVIIIGVAQQRKPKFSLLCKILTELRGDARYTKSMYALLSRSIVLSLLCYCVRNRDHCCVLCDVARDLLLTWYIVHQLNFATRRRKAFLFSKFWFTISHEHSKSFHLNFIYKLQT